MRAIQINFLESGGSERGRENDLLPPSLCRIIINLMIKFKLKVSSWGDSHIIYSYMEIVHNFQLISNLPINYVAYPNLP